MVESGCGQSVEGLFRERGEGYVREREWEALASLAERTRIVAATGGGLFLAATHQSFIRRHGASVWLDVPLEIIWERGRQEVGRPLFTTYEELAALLESRRGRYALADHRIDVDDRDVDWVVKEILNRFRVTGEGASADRSHEAHE
jgi:shikimate kinase